MIYELCEQIVNMHKKETAFFRGLSALYPLCGSRQYISVYSVAAGSTRGSP